MWWVQVHHILAEIIQGGLVLETNVEEISNSGASWPCSLSCCYGCGVFLGEKIHVLSESTLLLAGTNRTSSKGSVQSTQGLICVSEPPCSGDWRWRCSKWGTTDTAWVVDGQVDGGKRTVDSPNRERTVQRCYHGFGLVHTRTHVIRLWKSEVDEYRVK